MYLTEESSTLDNHDRSAFKDTAAKTDLSCVADIGLQEVFKCVTHVCPGIVDNGLYVNIDYQVLLTAGKGIEFITMPERRQFVANWKQFCSV